MVDNGEKIKGKVLVKFHVVPLNQGDIQEVYKELQSC
jgi:hypothetical protein